MYIDGLVYVNEKWLHSIETENEQKKKKLKRTNNTKQFVRSQIVANNFKLQTI